MIFSTPDFPVLHNLLEFAQEYIPYIVSSRHTCGPCLCVSGHMSLWIPECVSVCKYLYVLRRRASEGRLWPLWCSEVFGVSGVLVAINSLRLKPHGFLSCCVISLLCVWDREMWVLLLWCTGASRAFWVSPVTWSPVLRALSAPGIFFLSPCGSLSPGCLSKAPTIRCLLLCPWLRPLGRFPGLTFRTCDAICIATLR